MAKINRIVVHCSASPTGSAIEIDKWHRARGFRCIGYVGVISNGRPIPGVYWPFADGQWEWGRPVNGDQIIDPWEVQAQALGYNDQSVGFCMIGNPPPNKLAKTDAEVRNIFTLAQIGRMKIITSIFLAQFKLPISAVICHNEVEPGKSCPGFTGEWLRNFIARP